MKKFVLEFVLRGLVACGFCPIVLAILYLIISCQSGLESISVTEVCIGNFSLTALAFIAGGMNAIYKIERLALSVAILIHGAVLYIAYLATYLINGWLKSGSLPILVFSVIFILGYLAVWAVIYFTTKKKTEKLNAMLKKKQDSIADQTK